MKEERNMGNKETQILDMNMIGKVFLSKKYVSEAYILVVAGYDHLNKCYLAHEIGKGKTNTNWRSYFDVTETLLNDLKTPEELMKEIDGIVNEMKSFTDIYDYMIRPQTNEESKKEARQRKETAERLFLRIKECSHNIEILERYVRNEATRLQCERERVKPNKRAINSLLSSMELYEKELRQTKKGLRRAEKRLHGMIGKENYNIMMKWLKENEYKSPRVEKYKMETWVKLREKLEMHQSSCLIGQKK